MPDYRHAGTFWPANAGGEHPNSETILLLPGSGSLVFVVADSARFWWRAIKARAALAVWRGLPRPDRLPAHLGWDGNRVADECMNLFDEQEHSGVEWFTPLNELQFRKESGEDWQGYADMAQKLARLRLQLRRKFSQKFPTATVKLLFPAWVPGDDLDRADEWIDEAMQWDGLRVHIYNNADEIRSRYWAHRNLLIERYGERGRTFPILVDETNANHTGADEREMVLANAEVCRDDPYCLGFCWYIWETNNAGENDLSIWGNPDRLALFLHPPTVVAQPPTIPEEPPMNEYETFCRTEAARRGIDPEIAVRVANSEGSLTEPARRGTFDTGSSWWAFQLHYGGAGYEHLGTVAGMGNDFTAATGWAPGDPLAWRDAMRWALDRAKWSGWGPWYGAAAVGIGVWDGIDRALPWAVTPENEWDYKTSAPVPETVRYDPNTPAIPQDDDWSCAPTSLRWALTALGRNPGPQYIENLLVQDGVVSQAQGLLDATGAGLAAWIGKTGAAYYGGDGFYGNSEATVSFDGAAHEGDHAYPILIGGRTFGPGGHWVAVRGYDPVREVLLIMNPSDGFTGIGQELTREQFDARGPWSMVRVLHNDLLTAVPEPPIVLPPEDTRIKVLVSEIRERLEEIERLAS